VEEVADAESEVSEWELRERMEREEERGAETEALGAEVEVGDGEEPPLFHPTPVHGFFFFFFLFIQYSYAT